MSKPSKKPQPETETAQDLSDEELAELERWAHGAFPTTALYRNMLACIAMARRKREAEAECRRLKARPQVHPGHHPPCKAMLDSEAVCTCGQ